MAVTTFIRPDDIRHSTDPDILKALAGLRHPPVVDTVSITVKAHWWQRARRETRYEVLWPLGETLMGLEWQVVNFHQEETGTSINLVVPKSLVLAYLWGIGTGEAARDQG